MKSIKYLLMLVLISSFLLVRVSAIDKQVPQDLNIHTLYAITLAWPEETLIVKSLIKSNINDQTVKSVTLLGSNESLHWDQTMHGLSVVFPAMKPCQYAYTLKIEFE